MESGYNSDWVNAGMLNLTCDWPVPKDADEETARGAAMMFLGHFGIRQSKEELEDLPTPDTLTWVVSDERGLLQFAVESKEMAVESKPDAVYAMSSARLPPTLTTFYPAPGGIIFRSRGQAIHLPMPGPSGELETLQRDLTARNEKFGHARLMPQVVRDLLTELEAKTPAKAPAELAHPLHDAAIMRVPNDIASTFAMRAITNPVIWKTNENDCHKYAEDRKNKAVVIYSPDEEIPEYWQDFRERVLQSLESRFASMKGELVADVADILFWHWLSNDRPAHAGITLSQILEYRGVKPRPNVIEEHWLAMRDVRAIRLRGAGIESEALFHVSAAQPNLFGTAEPPKLQTVYRYHPGYFLSEAIQRDAFFLAYYARSVWQLNYYSDANAKKLARVLRADWRRNAESYLPGGKPRYRTWGALLADAGIDTTSGEAVIHPMQFIKAIERELEKLYEIEFIRECCPAIYHPDDQEKRANLPPKGKLQVWLSLRTHIAPAADITDALTQTATRRLALKAERKAIAEGSKKPKKARKVTVQ